METHAKKRIVHSRYGDERVIIHQGHGVYSMTGKSKFYRVGGGTKKITFFDPTGGPFICMDSAMDEFDGRIVTDILVEDAPEGHFKITVETEESDEQPRDPWQ